jgi:hypothetical protein
MPSIPIKSMFSINTGKFSEKQQNVINEFLSTTL